MGDGEGVSCCDIDSHSLLINRTAVVVGRGGSWVEMGML